MRIVGGRLRGRDLVSPNDFRVRPTAEAVRAELLEALGADSYDVAFADPPYGSKILDRVIAAWRQSRFARVFAVEHDPAHDLPPGERRLAFPEAAITIYRL